MLFLRILLFIHLGVRKSPNDCNLFLRLSRRGESPDFIFVLSFDFFWKFVTLRNFIDFYQNCWKKRKFTKQGTIWNWCFPPFFRVSYELLIINFTKINPLVWYILWYIIFMRTCRFTAQAMTNGRWGKVNKNITVHVHVCVCVFLMICLLWGLLKHHQI